VVLGFIGDLQRYADGRVPTAGATRTGKISKYVPVKIATENFGCLVWG